MNEFIADVRLLEILQENNFNQTASARFLSNGDTDKFEKFRYHIKRRIDLCEFISKANKKYKSEKSEKSWFLGRIGGALS